MIMVLPSPDFENVQQPRFETVVQRAVDGTTYSFNRRNGRYRIVYQFGNLSVPKSAEVKQFVEAYAASDILLTDFNELVWLVKLATIPTFDEPSTKTILTTLEFEGMPL